jgi:hypothetical protein
MLRLLVALALAESVARTVKVAVPAEVGVPEIAPAVSMESPPGRLPDSSDHVYGGVPPLALTEAE